MGFAAGFQSGSYAVTSGVSAGIKFAENFRKAKEEERRIKERAQNMTLKESEKHANLSVSTEKELSRLNEKRTAYLENGNINGYNAVSKSMNNMKKSFLDITNNKNKILKDTIGEQAPSFSVPESFGSLDTDELKETTFNNKKFFGKKEEVDKFNENMVKTEGYAGVDANGKLGHYIQDENDSEKFTDKINPMFEPVPISIKERKMLLDEKKAKDIAKYRENISSAKKDKAPIIGFNKDGKEIVFNSNAHLANAISKGEVTKSKPSKPSSDGKYWYNPKTNDFKFFSKGDSVEKGYIPESQYGKIGKENKGVSKAKTKLSEERLMNIQSEGGVEKIREEYRTGFDKKLNNYFTSANVPDEVLDLFINAETNMANSNPEKHGEFSLLPKDKKVETLLQAIGKPEVKTSIWSRIAPFFDDIVLRKKLEDGNIEVTGSLSDQLDVALPLHQKVLVDLYGMLIDFKNKKKKEQK